MTDEEIEKEKLRERTTVGSKVFRSTEICINWLNQIWKEANKIIRVIKDCGNYDDKCKKAFDKYLSSIISADEAGRRLCGDLVHNIPFLDDNVDEEALPRDDMPWLKDIEKNNECENDDKSWEFEGLHCRLEDSHLTLVMCIHRTFQEDVLAPLRVIGEDAQYKPALTNFDKALSNVLDACNDALGCIYDITETPDFLRLVPRPEQKKQIQKQDKLWRKMTRKSLKEKRKEERALKRRMRKYESQQCNEE